MVYHELKTQDFLNKNYNQNVNQRLLMDSLKETNKVTSFSTFPYINYNYNSTQSINNFNSGNCIAL